MRSKTVDGSVSLRRRKNRIIKNFNLFGHMKKQSSNVDVTLLSVLPVRRRRPVKNKEDANLCNHFYFCKVGISRSGLKCLYVIKVS